MAKIFKKSKTGNRKSRPRRDFRDKKRTDSPIAVPQRPKTTAKDLVDPVLYIGGLEKDKYPTLPLENDKKPEEEIENPLNKR